MIIKIQKILRQAVKDYDVQTSLPNEDTLITLLSAELYRNLVVQPAEQALTQTRKRRGEDGLHQA